LERGFSRERHPFHIKKRFETKGERERQYLTLKGGGVLFTIKKDLHINRKTGGVIPYSFTKERWVTSTARRGGGEEKKVS